VIDWLTIRFPCHAAKDFRGDKIIKVDANGRTIYEISARHEVRGSFCSDVTLRPLEELSPTRLSPLEIERARLDGGRRARQALEDRAFYNGPGFQISGCPPKFLQGHNCFGDEDLRGYAVAMIEDALTRINVSLWPEERAGLEAGKFKILRVDVTQMLELSSSAAVNAVIRACEYGAALRRRGHGQIYSGGESVVFGAGSRRWSLTMYAKGVEMKKHPPKLKEAECEKLQEYAARALRVEIRLHGKELAGQNLEFGSAWRQDTAARLYNEYIAAVNIAGDVAMTDDFVNTLRPALRDAYKQWRDGVDLRDPSVMTKRTFYRHRAELLKFGVDIAMKQPKKAAFNVIPLRSVFEAKPLGIPDWARGTPLYFDTSRVTTKA